MWKTFFNRGFNHGFSTIFHISWYFTIGWILSSLRLSCIWQQNNNIFPNKNPQEVDFPLGNWTESSSANSGDWCYIPTISPCPSSWPGYVSAFDHVVDPQKVVTILAEESTQTGGGLVTEHGDLLGALWCFMTKNCAVSHQNRGSNMCNWDLHTKTLIW